MPYPFLRLPNELVSDALTANGRTVSSHVFYPETVHYLHPHNFITNHSSWDSRPSSKFGLFLSISVNSDWVLQWRSIGKIYWEGFTNNQYIWIQSNNAYFIFYIMENRSTWGGIFAASMCCVFKLCLLFCVLSSKPLFLKYLLFFNKMHME